MAHARSEDGASVPRVSVVVATYNRASLVPRLIAALEKQTLPSDAFEVIVVDDGSTDGTPAVLSELAAKSSLRIRLAGDGRNRRQSAARNLGWPLARAPIVAFTDDDCVPSPEWLERGLEAMGSEARIAMGPVIPDPEQRYLEGPFSRSIEVKDATLFETCNVFYRRADLEAVRGFDEAFSAHGGEDTDLGWRIRDRGIEPVFAPDALVLHDVKPSDLLAATKEALRWTGIPRVVKLHPESRRLLVGGVFWKPSHPGVLAALAGLALAPRSRLALLLSIPWIWHRVATNPVVDGPRRRWLMLPGAFVVDLAEVVAMVRGSIKAKTIVL